MKKLYSTAEYARRVKKRQERELKARRRGAHSPKSADHTIVRKYSPPLSGQRRVQAPVEFSLIKNQSEMLAFYDEVYEQAHRRRRVWIDLSRVESFSADAILYMLSLFESLGAEGNYSVSGNVPKAEPARRVLTQSGFFKHVSTAGTSHASSPDVLEVKSGTLVEPVIAKAVVDFAALHRQRPADSRPQGVYRTLIECMANTKNHAYGEKRAGKWWLMALAERDKGRVQFAFLDNGKGIPSTLRKNPSERFRDLVLLGRDEQLIESALLGEFRTRTGQRYRGKGLPGIVSEQTSGEIADLCVVANRGCVRCRDWQSTQLPGKFNGTLLSWDFV